MKFLVVYPQWRYVTQEQNLRTCDHVRVALAGLPQNVVVSSAVVCFRLLKVEDSHSNALVTASPLPTLATSFVSVTSMMRTVESWLFDDLITAEKRAPLESTCPKSQ